MEVVNHNAAALSNYEVLSLLQELKGHDERGQRKIPRTLRQLATIAYETTKYLEETPAKHQSPEIIESFLRGLAPYKLTKAEKLMLLNHRPTTPVEIQLMVEESEERLTDEQVEGLLEVVARFLPGDPQNESWPDEDDG